MYKDDFKMYLYAWTERKNQIRMHHFSSQLENEYTFITQINSLPNILSHSEAYNEIFGSVSDSNYVEVRQFD